MTQYIDKSALVAETKRLIRANELYLSELETDEVRFQKTGAYSVLNDLLHFLDTLEVKEMSNIWHTISDRDVDLPKAGDVICFIKNGKVISGEYRLNKFYGKVNNGYDNPIEKGDKWCFFLTSSDLLSK